VLEEELLIVGDLEVQLRPKLLLNPLREEPGEHVPDVNAARGPSTRVQRERRPLLVLVEDPIQVPVAVEHAAPAHRMELAGGLPDPIQNLGRDPLRPELGHEPAVVYEPLDIPWREDEDVPHFDSVLRP